MKRAFVLVSILAAATAGLLPLASRAQSAQTGIEIQPAIVERDLSSRDYATPVKLINHEADPYDISLSVQELDQNLDGSPRFSASSRLAGAFHLSETDFTLDPGATKEVQLSGSIPSGAPSAYFGVVALLTRSGAQQGSTVAVKTQNVAEFLLRGPKPWTERISVIDVGVLPGASPSSKLVYATVKNLGNVHVRPSGRVEVIRHGKLIGTVVLEKAASGVPPAILPTCGDGCARRLIGTWEPPPKLNGNVTLRANIFHPAASAQRSVKFQGGVALDPSARISFVHAGADDIEVEVDNTGPITLSQASVTLFATQDGKFERGRKIFTLGDLGSSKSTDVTWTAGLGDGSYTITAQVSEADKLLDQSVTGLQIGAKGAASSHTLLVIIGAVLLALAAAGLVWFLLKRKQRAEPATA